VYLWVDTNVSVECTASNFRVEAGDSMFLYLQVHMALQLRKPNIQIFKFLRTSHLTVEVYGCLNQWSATILITHPYINKHNYYAHPILAYRLIYKLYRLCLYIYIYLFIYLQKHTTKSALGLRGLFSSRTPAEHRAQYLGCAHSTLKSSGLHDCNTPILCKTSVFGCEPRLINITLRMVTAMFVETLDNS
jgi:hypothetical protein